ncbi:uncharacterized protein [Triticum aestivum]|uniref:uncharacterized protein n=1 Tax=Triticum aestivum TaxID=4565 RepID=UPI001D029816|nr:uncharacterized protein LOC123055815 [Triticum aestivum]
MSSCEDKDSAATRAAAKTDVELLKRFWRNKKVALEILHFDSAHVSRALWPLEETFDYFMDNGIDDLMVSLYRMELDRTLFMLCSYLFLHLQKIEKYMAHISNSVDLLSRLTQQQERFAKRYLSN